jgi:hypothetical protein
MATNETLEINTDRNIIKIPDNNYQSISLKAIKIPSNMNINSDPFRK